jgi:site-specific recombinase XerD
MSDALARWREIAPDSPHGLVWPALDGDPASPAMDRAEWYGLQGAAEIGHPAGRHYTLHEARNTTATLLLELGVDESVRLAIMGHSSIATTRGYEHVDLTQTRRALDGVAERLQLVASPRGAI